MKYVALPLICGLCEGQRHHNCDSLFPDGLNLQSLKYSSTATHYQYPWFVRMILFIHYITIIVENVHCSKVYLIHTELKVMHFLPHRGKSLLLVWYVVLILFVILNTTG